MVWVSYKDPLIEELWHIFNFIKKINDISKEILFQYAYKMSAHPI